jgi:hypothetical protein
MVTMWSIPDSRNLKRHKKLPPFGGVFGVKCNKPGCYPGLLIFMVEGAVLEPPVECLM